MKQQPEGRKERETSSGKRHEGGSKRVGEGLIHSHILVMHDTRIQLTSLNHLFLKIITTLIIFPRLHNLKFMDLLFLFC